MEPSYPIASALGLEHHCPILSMVEICGGQLREREREKGGSVSDFVVNDIIPGSGGGYKFTKGGLINRVLETTGIHKFNKVSTHPKSVSPLVSGPDDAHPEEYWYYASVIEIILYLEAKSRMEIAFVEHQFILFTHNNKGVS